MYCYINIVVITYYFLGSTSTYYYYFEVFFRIRMFVNVIIRVNRTAGTSVMVQTLLMALTRKNI